MIPEQELRKRIKSITDNAEVLRIVLDINSLKIQGAKNVALASLNALKILYDEEGLTNNFFNLIDLLQNLRYTQVITFNALEIVKKYISKDPKIFDKLIKYIKESYMKINENLVKELSNMSDNNIKILTHCHSSEEVSSLIYAKNKGFNLTVYVTETRPKYQGIKTAKELLESGINVIYIVDSASGLYIDDIDLVLFGCDAIRKEGIVNKIGTYMISLCAKEHKKFVWFVGDLLKTDLREKFEIEMRDPKEIIDPKEIPGAKILNPAFDLTPWRLIDKVITDKRVYEKFNLISDEFKNIENYLIL